LCSAWGNDPRYEVCDVRVKLQALGSNFLFHPAASVTSGFNELCEHTYPKFSSANGFLRVGRHRSTDLLASRTPLRPHLLYAYNTSRSNYLTVLPRVPTQGR
jgi:hypothetical protein